MASPQKASLSASLPYQLMPPHSGQKKRRKDKKKLSPTEPPAAIDKSYLCCEHHKAMVAGLCLLGGPNPLPGDKSGGGRLCPRQVWGRRVGVPMPQLPGEGLSWLGYPMCPSQSGLGGGGLDGWCGHSCPGGSPRRSLLAGTLLTVLVVGLGGGSLPLFIHDYFSQAHVAVVEIDPSMLEVATRWFGFSQDDRMQVHVSDGVDYVAKLAAEGITSQNIPGTLPIPVGDVLGTRALDFFHPLLPIPAHLLPCVATTELTTQAICTSFCLFH